MPFHFFHKNKPLHGLFLDTIGLLRYIHHPFTAVCYDLLAVIILYHKTYLYSIRFHKQHVFCTNNIFFNIDMIFCIWACIINLRYGSCLRLSDISQSKYIIQYNYRVILSAALTSLRLALFHFLSLSLIFHRFFDIFIKKQAHHNDHLKIMRLI